VRSTPPEGSTPFTPEVGPAGRHRIWATPERGRITLTAWSDQYMSTVVHLRPTTITLYDPELVHILARFGRTQLVQLEPLAIQVWLSKIMAGGMASSSVHRKYRALRGILQVAVDKGIIVTNPCRLFSAQGRDQRDAVPHPPSSSLSWTPSTLVPGIRLHGRRDSDAMERVGSPTASQDRPASPDHLGYRADGLHRRSRIEGPSRGSLETPEAEDQGWPPLHRSVALFARSSVWTRAAALGAGAVGAYDEHDGLCRPNE
jgi:hypothetical protein